MLSMKKNHKTGAYEMATKAMNIHPMVKAEAVPAFEEAFSREMLRFETARIFVKCYNGVNVTEDDNAKFELLLDTMENQYDVIMVRPDGTINEDAFKTSLYIYDSKNADICNDSNLQTLLYYTILAHNGNTFLTGIKAEENDLGLTEYKLVYNAPIKITELDGLYTSLKKNLPSVFSGNVNLADMAKAIKQDYEKAVSFFCSEKESAGAKKWTVSVKLHERSDFINGLYGTHKLTKFNKIKRTSPMDSFPAFQSYFLMWLVTDGAMVKKSKKSDNVELAGSALARLMKNV